METLETSRGAIRVAIPSLPVLTQSVAAAVIPGVNNHAESLSPRPDWASYAIILAPFQTMLDSHRVAGL